MSVTPIAYLVLGGLLLTLGLAGVIARRDPLAQLGALGVMLLGPVVAAAGLASVGPESAAPYGTALTAAAVVVLCAQVALVGALSIRLRRRRRGPVDLNEPDPVSGAEG